MLYIIQLLKLNCLKIDNKGVIYSKEGDLRLTKVLYIQDMEPSINIS